MKAAFFSATPETIARVYAGVTIEGIYPEVITPGNIGEHLDALGDIEVIFSTWGFWPLAKEHLDALAGLRAVFYAAGSVKGFARPLLERGILVSSAARANGIFVAEFAFAQILLAQKGYFRLLRGVEPGAVREIQGNYAAKVGVIGAGHIGRMMVEKLRAARAEVFVYDPYLSPEQARAMGAQKAELDQIFATCEVVSNHAPNIPATRGMITRAHFAAMPKNAAFINTGRGATVDEAGLVSVFAQRPDLTALLDVTDPEPAPADSPLRRLPNVLISPHIAGAVGREVRLMAELSIGEYARYARGEALEYAVTLEEFDRLA